MHMRRKQKVTLTRSIIYFIFKSQIYTYAFSYRDSKVAAQVIVTHLCTFIIRCLALIGLSNGNVIFCMMKDFDKLNFIVKLICSICMEREKRVKTERKTRDLFILFDKNKSTCDRVAFIARQLQK